MTFRLAVVSVLVALVAQAAGVSAADSQRVALVIGNAKYPDNDKPLKEPINDVRDIVDELKRDGFDVDVQENLNGDGMRKAFDRLYAKVKPGSAALVFFSGYGIQSARQSYMIPVDAQIWTESDVRRDGVSLETVLSELNGRGASVKIALMDASRRNPFERRFRSFSAGLAPIITPNGSLVMYSAALSSVVSDSGGDRSLFVSELLKEIRVPGLTAEETLNRTRLGVTRASRNEQNPWISSSLADDFAFVPGPVHSNKEVIADSLPPRRNPPSLPTQPTSVSGNTGIVPPTLPEPPALPPDRPTKTASAPPSIVLPPVTTPGPVTTTTLNGDDKALEKALADDPTVKTLNDKLLDNPGDANALYRRGQVYASKGAYGLALRDFDETIRLNPRDVEAYNNRCWVRTVVGDLQQALRDCNEALRLRPNFVDALDSRGLVNLKSGLPKNAIADFDAALKINPRLTSSLYGRGLAKQRNGAFAEGDIDVSSAKALDPNIAQEFASYGVR